MMLKSIETQSFANNNNRSIFQANIDLKTIGNDYEDDYLKVLSTAQIETPSYELVPIDPSQNLQNEDALNQQSILQKNENQKAIIKLSQHNLNKKIMKEQQNLLSHESKKHETSPDNHELKVGNHKVNEEHQDQLYHQIDQNDQIKHTIETNEVNDKNKIHQSSENHMKHQQNHQVHEHHGFDPFKIPCNWHRAQLHAKARETKPELHETDDHKPIEEGEQKKMLEVCECCGYEMQRKAISLNVDVMQLGFMGSGFPLYFNYIKFCCLMLLSLFLIQGIPDIVKNWNGNFCVSSQVEVYAAVEEDHKHHDSNFIAPCPTGNLNRLSIANILNELKNETDYNFHYSIAAVIVQVFLSILFRRSQRKIEQEVDQQNSTPSDYTIMVENISHKIGDIQGVLKEKFEIYGKIEKINLVYDITELEELESQIKRTVQQKQQAFIKIGSINYEDKEIKQIDEQIHILEQKVHKLEDEMKQNPSKYFIGTAFISFSREQEKQTAIQSNPHSYWLRFKSYFNNGKAEQTANHLYVDERYLYVSEAPEPNDIDWEFAHVKTNEKLRARTIAFTKWFILTLISLAVICAITYIQSIQTDHILEEEYKIQKESNETELNEQQKDELDSLATQKAGVTVLSFVISSLIVLWNKFFLPFVIHQICDHEKWSTKTNLNVSFAFKLTIGLFFNTALITFLVEIIFFKNIYAFAGGMIYNEFLVFILNAIVPCVAWVIDPWKLYQDFRRRRERKKVLCVLTQQEANLLMEHPSYTMGKRYADIMKTMWFTFFYSPIMPIGTIISLGGLILYYISDKYNLIHRRTVKESISSKLSIQMIELVEFSIVFHTFGQVFFKWFLCKNIDVGNFFLFIVILVIVIIVPMHRINELVFPFKGLDEQKTYEEVVIDFDTDYDRENPVTKRQSLLKYHNSRNEVINIAIAKLTAKKMAENHHLAHKGDAIHIQIE